MKTLIIFISILFSATYMYAQTNYYATTKKLFKIRIEKML